MKFFLFCMIATKTMATPLEDDVDHYFTLLSGSVRYSPLDGAGSHGGLSAQLGAGLSDARMNEESSIVGEQTKTAKEGEFRRDRNLSAARLYILKGLISPVDIGVTAAGLNGAKAFIYGGHLQVTLFEAFRMPAIALRASYAQTTGLQSSHLSTLGGEAVLSYGFLRYFTMYGSAGLTQAKGSLSLESNSTALIDSGFQRYDASYSEQTLYTSLGLHLQLVPGVLAAVVEGQSHASGRVQQILGKLAYGL